MNISHVLRLLVLADSAAYFTISYRSFLRKRVHPESLSCSEMGDFVM